MPITTDVNLTAQELAEFCNSWVRSFKQKQLILLDGPLGVGKTSLVQAAVRALGGSGASSPTFSLIQTYSISEVSEISHVDLYRLDGDDDLESTGFWDLFSVPAGIVFLEWSSRLSIEDLPLDWPQLRCEIHFTDREDQRRYIFSDLTTQS